MEGGRGGGVVWFGKYSVGCVATGSWKREGTALPLATVVALQTMWAGANTSQEPWAPAFN